MATGSASRRWGPWWGVLLTLAGVALGMTAGFWQLGRAQEKRDLEARFAAGAASVPVARLVASSDTATMRYRTLRLRGHYDPEHQVLLDNMSYRGRPGYQVLTPFLTTDGNVLVNRGWVPADGDRTVIPDVRVDAGDRVVTGRIERLPRPALELRTGPPPADAPWPRRLLFPTSAEIAVQLGPGQAASLRDYQLLLDPADPDGFIRDWRPGGIGPERHFGYAVQWFGLALTVIVIYAVLIARNRIQAS